LYARVLNSRKNDTDVVLVNLVL